jgi:glycosyltransferase involved in cell wall biosynthesis
MISNTPNVEYMEPVKDIRDFYKHCRLLLMPSEREEAGTVPFEATLNGIPCISSDVMGLPETNRGGIILPISIRPWDSVMPCHPDNESVTAWEKIINELDSPSYYNSVVQNQRDFMASIPYSGLYDELSGKLGDIVRDFRRG